jgi:hypothetical protein
MMNDDINEEDDDELQTTENQTKTKWYLIDTERTFCKVWNFIITIVTIYSLIVVPFVLVFHDVYEYCPDHSKKNNFLTSSMLVCEDINTKENVAPVIDPTLYRIELTIDIIFVIEIILNMLKKTRANKDIESIARSYVFGYFLFDVAGTVPELIHGECLDYYWLKLFRITHANRLTVPL